MEYFVEKSNMTLPKPKQNYSTKYIVYYTALFEPRSLFENRNAIP